MERQTEIEGWEVLNDLRQGYSDEIPDEIIHGINQDKRFKVRKNWFTAVVGTLGIFVDEGVIVNPDIKDSVHEFREKYTSKEFHNQDRVTVTDIEEGNRILDLVLSSRNQ